MILSKSNTIHIMTCDMMFDNIFFFFGFDRKTHGIYMIKKMFFLECEIQKIATTK